MKHDAYKTLDVAREALSAIVFAYARIILAAMGDSRKVLRLCQKMSAAVRRQVRLQAKLYRHVLAEDLAMNPALQKRVCRELGGKTAMVNWEVRRRGARIQSQFIGMKRTSGRTSGLTPSDTFEPAKPPASNPKPRKKWQPRTDRFGEYRLAVIKTGQRTTRKIIKQKTRRVSLTHTWRFHPVEITPEDLRVNVSFDDRFPPPSDSGSPNAGYSPPIERPPI